MRESKEGRPPQGTDGQPRAMPARLLLRPAARPDFPAVLNIVREAEGLGADAVLIAGGRGALDPLTTVAALAPLTSRIGLLAEVNAAETHPYTAARRLAALDHVSNGRIGWSLTENTESARIQDYAAAVHALWDSWDDDVHRYDKRSGVYIDTDGIGPAAYAGPFYRVAGPLDIPRPPQGRLPRVGDDRTADASFTGWLEMTADQIEWIKLRDELGACVIDTARQPRRTLRRCLGLMDVPPQHFNRLAACQNP
ncbi:LLM class flavin-dependent oxidoreductase [Achromobacter sp.]|uniref:LLM class flavin-dependent oxidoreductase n=1 Tax=Achromobacter sp. TaxID=134375 RepID=UPI003C76137F